MPGPIQSVERAAAILRLLAGSARPLGLAEVSRGLGLAKGTALGILRTLQGVGFVEQDLETGRYGLGPGVLHLGSRYLDGNELRTRALNWSDALAARSGESVRIGTLHEQSVLVVHHVFRPDDSHQTLDVGALLPLHATGLGKVLVAFDPHALVDVRDLPLKTYTSRTVTSPPTLTAELKLARERGWAAGVEELVEGEVSIAAPIRDRRTMTVGAIGISGAVERLCPNGPPRMDLVSYVRDAARAISRELGATPW